MRIKKIQIKNFKSLVDFELEDLKPFCAFVGPNASGKSNIFEALEFTNYVAKFSLEAASFFGGPQNIVSFSNKQVDKTGKTRNVIYFDIIFADEIRINFATHFAEKLQEKHSQAMVSVGRYLSDDQLGLPLLPVFEIKDLKERDEFLIEWEKVKREYENDFEYFIDNFSRIFIGKSSLKRTPDINGKLAPDASNLSQVIGKVFEEESARTDFVSWLRILIPEFKNIEIKQSNIDGSFEFFIYEKSSNKPFPKHLISDGTYNILALMAAVYQTNEPQFLCIEEPENGLHPQAIQLLVDFFREKCEEHGHYIWLNTHSQTLVRCLEIDEIILVNKVDGETKAKQLTKEDNIDLKTDEAWLSNALGGGILWSK